MKIEKIGGIIYDVLLFVLIWAIFCDYAEITSWAISLIAGIIMGIILQMKYKT